MSQNSETPAHADGGQENPGSLSLSYHELRSLAEYASSIRGKDTYFIRGDKGWEAHESAEDLPIGVQPIHVFNPATPEHPRVHKARIWARDTEGEGFDLLKIPDPRTGEPVQADAVFWTESAVEKFLVPYYASVYGDKANVVVDELLRGFNPSHGAAAGEGETGAFALVHIPRSEYVTVDASGTSLLVLVPEAKRWAITVEEHLGLPRK